MKKIVLTVLGAAMATASYAGGILTNTNQNAAFLRQFSQNATIDITGLYFNPAGTAFLNDGWHLSLNIQNARQQRNITTTLPFFVANTANPGQASHKFEGKAYAPVIPSFQLSYNHKKWSVNANFALCGGGGKCEFDKGLGSFESIYSSTIFGKKSLIESMVKAQLPGVVAQGIQAAVPGLDGVTANSIASTGEYNANLAGYNMDAYMKGRQYYFGLTLGTTYKITDNMAFFAGVRGVYANCEYVGHVKDVNAVVKYTYDVPAIPGAFPGTSGNGYTNAPLNSDLTLECDQNGFGLTPVVGIDWRINKHWNIAAKYEWKTKMRLKNKSQIGATEDMMASAGSVLGQFADGKKVAADIPGTLSLGAQYSPCTKVRLNAGFNYYFDQDATQYGNKEELLDKNTYEVTTGAEWDICKWFTLSASWQKTEYGFSDAYMNDVSFNLSSNSLGVGFRVNATEKVHIDFGYMHTFYKDMNVTTMNGMKNDIYNRKNRVFGLGVNLDF